MYIDLIVNGMYIRFGCKLRCFELELANISYNFGKIIDNLHLRNK